MKKLRNFKGFNWIGFFTLYLKKDSLIPIYRKITRVYISFKQKKVYDKSSIKLNNEFKSNNEDIQYIEGVINKKSKNIVNITFIGNSIALSLPSKNNIWDNNWGMAASNSENAYPQLIAKKISQKFNYRVNYSIYNLSSIALRRRYPEKIINKIIQENPDILIVQLGDNALRKDINIFRNDLTQFLKKLPNYKCTIFATPFYPDETKNEVFQEISSELNFFLVDLSNIISASDTPIRVLAKYENNFSDPGVNAHPGDYGMLKIANQIFPTVNKCLNY